MGLGVVEAGYRGDKRIPSALDIHDIAVAKLAVTKCLADCGHVDPEASLRDGYVRPNVINELVFRYDLARTLDEIDQNIERSPAQRKCEPVATEFSPIA
jgi:hypothetical protein